MSSRAPPDPLGPFLVALPIRGREAWSKTTVEKTLWPPCAGTHRWQELLGRRLVCVRYRYSSDGEHRYTTVELLVDHGRVVHKPSGRPGYTIKLREEERQLARQLASTGARWDAASGQWLVKSEVVRRLRLHGRARKVKAG